MKTFLCSIMLLIWILLPGSASADHHEVFIHQVVLLDTNSCAVQLEIDLANQDAFQGTDRIELNGTTIASLGDAEAAAINTGGNVNAGDMILFASDTFSGDAGIAADVNFDDASCANFQAGGVFTFVIDDPIFGGPNAVIDTLVAPTGFTVNTAGVKASEVSTPQLFVLNFDDITVGNNSGAEVTLGNSPTPSSGSCGLTQGQPGSSGGILAVGLGLLFLVGVQRWRGALRSDPPAKI